MKYGMLKRAAGTLLAAALVLGSLTGCSGKGNESASNGNTKASDENGAEGDGKEQAKGRFLEEDVTLPIVFGNIFDMKKLEDGTIRIIGINGDNGTKTVWDSKDLGANWEKAFDAPKEIQDEGNGYVDYAALSSDGQSVWVYNQIGDGGITHVLYLVDQEGNGSVIPFELPAAEGEAFSTDNPIENLIMRIGFLGSEQLLIKDMTGKIFQISVVDGSVKQTYDFSDSEDAHEIYVVGNKILIATSSEILIYDGETTADRGGITEKRCRKRTF